MKESTRKPYPSDVSDEEWAFAAPYLTLMDEEAPQREHDLREVYNALRWVVRTGSPWRYIPHDPRMILRLDAKREPDPTAVVLDSRTLRSPVESGDRAGHNGHKRKKGSKIHAAVDTLGHLLALHVTPANEQDRAQVAALAEAGLLRSDEAGGITLTKEGRELVERCVDWNRPRCPARGASS